MQDRLTYNRLETHMFRKERIRHNLHKKRKKKDFKYELIEIGTFICLQREISYELIEIGRFKYVK